MKNMKPFILGCIAGCGGMFVGLQYHVVQSHDGLQLIPRAPQSTLGLAWADVRNWDAEKWSERPALVRALVAHGSPDLISESIANEIGDSRGPDSGTIGQLRSLLNGSLLSEFDAPLFGSDAASGLRRSNHDSLNIPFPQETRKPEWDDSFTSSADHDPSRANLADRTPSWMNDDADFKSRFSEFDKNEPNGVKRRPSKFERSTRDRFSEFSERSRSDPFTETESTWQSIPRSEASSRTNADARERETTILEDLLFSEEDTLEPISRSHHTEFDSLTQALDFRASRAIDRANGGIYGHSDDLNGGIASGYVRDQKRSGLPRFGDDTGPAPVPVPRAIRALREGFDPFLD